MLAKVTDHAARAVARLAQWAQEVPELVAMVEALAATCQDLEDAAWDVIVKRLLKGTGHRLDQVGMLLDEPRAGADDSTYYARLVAKGRALRSCGTVPDLLAVFSLLVPDNDVAFQNRGRASLVLDVGLIDPSLEDVFYRFMRYASQAGTDAQVLWTFSGPDDTFALDDVGDPGSTPGLGLADVGTPGSGGRLAAVGMTP